MKTATLVPRLFLAGDSTVWDVTADWKPMAGWGQFLPEFFLRAKVAIDNQAFAGRSLRSFLDEGRLSKILQQLKPGDWVFIQFGHNDAKLGPHFAHPRGSYRSLLRFYAGEIQSRKATPLLISPVERLRFGIDGRFRPSHGEMGQALRQVAAELGLPCIDLSILSQQVLVSAGPELAKAFFLNASPGEMERFPAGYCDDTHLSAAGARLIAGLVAQNLREQKLEPAEWLA